MAIFSDEELNIIREKANIREVISQYIPVTQKGQNYWAMCPFHDDHNPSMSISESKQIYKCFVCHAGGNVFTFVRDYENISFVEAVVKVASTVGIDLSESLKSQTHDTLSDETKKQYEIMDESQKFYHYQLKTNQLPIVQSFLEKRNLSPEIIDAFGLGLAQSGSPLTKFLSAKGYSLEDLVKLDLSRRYEANFNDVFYDRLMFPIHNSYGNVVGYSGRALSNENDVKYVNTASTPIYIKGEILYNYHRILDRELKTYPLIIVEGVMDVLGFYRADLRKCVATLGTALTEKQARLIQRLNCPVVLAYDKDQPGQNATYQIGTALRKLNVKVSVYNNPSDLDPDELQKTSGSNALLATIEGAKHWIEFVIEHAVKLYSVHSYQSKRQVIDMVFTHLQGEDDIDKSYFINVLSQLTEFDRNELTRQLNGIRQEPMTPPKQKVRYKGDVPLLIQAEKEILSIILSSKQACFTFRDYLGYLINDDANAMLLKIYTAYHQSEEIEVANFINSGLNERQITMITDAISDPLYAQSETEDILRGAMDNVELVSIDQQIKSIHEQVRIETDTNKKFELAQKIQSLALRRNEIRQKEKRDETI